MNRPLASAPSSSEEVSAPDVRPAAVLVHGLASSPWFLRGFARRLEREGYRVRNWGYPTWRRPLAEHAASLRTELDALAADPDVPRIDLVAHSMGGVIVRAALSRGPLPKLGRLVLLASPQRGCRLATYAAPLLGGVFQPLRDLSDAEASYVNRLAPLPADLEIGVITAAFDHLVARRSAVPEAAREHVELATTHSGLLFRRKPVELTARFLRSGSFAGESPDRTPREVPPGEPP